MVKGPGKLFPQKQLWKEKGQKYTEIFDGLWGYTVCIYSTQHSRTQHTTKTYYEDTIVTHACHYAINRVTPHLPLQVEFHRPLYLTTSLASRLWPGWCCLTSFRILGSFDFK